MKLKKYIAIFLILITSASYSEETPKKIDKFKKIGGEVFDIIQNLEEDAKNKFIEEIAEYGKNYSLVTSSLEERKKEKCIELLSIKDTVDPYQLVLHQIIKTSSDQQLKSVGNLIYYIDDTKHQIKQINDFYSGKPFTYTPYSFDNFIKNSQMRYFDIAINTTIKNNNLDKNTLSTFIQLRGLKNFILFNECK